MPPSAARTNALGGAAPFNEESLRQTLRTLEMRITRKLDGLLFGQYQGLTPGHGSEPGEGRPYVPGDDVRRIDWNVTARTREVHVRDMIADRDLEAWLGIDVTASMSFGTSKALKRDVALGAAAAVGFLTARNQNKVGAVLALSGGAVGTAGTAGATRAFPPRVGRDHLRSILMATGMARPVDGSGRADLGALARDIGGRSRRRGFVCLISDFLAPPDTWKQSIGSLAMRHDVLAVEIFDPRERELPVMGTLTVVDPATGRVRDVNITESMRHRYAEAAARQHDAIRSELLAAGAHHLALSTADDWLGAIVRFVDQRRRNPMKPKGMVS